MVDFFVLLQRKGFIIFLHSFIGDGMFTFSGMKAAKAFAFGLVLSGVVVGCNEASQVATTVAPEAEAVSNGEGKASQGTQLTEQQIKDLQVFISAAREKRTQEISKFLAKPEAQEMSAGLEEIAQSVAMVIEDKEIRDRIYEKCLEKFDGETNVLWQHIEGDVKLRSKGGWNKAVKTAMDNSGKKATINRVGGIDAAITKFEKTVNAPLHLFWAFPKNWDKKTAPLVAFLPFDPNVKYATAFDSKGNRYQLDRNNPTVAKQRPVLVVGINERTEINGSLKKSLPKADKKLLGAGLQADTYSSYVILKDIFFSSVPLDYSPIGIYDEWGAGEPEFHICVQDYTGFWYMDTFSLNGNQELATNTPHTLNTVISWQHYPQKIKIQYWEEDFWFADDYIDEHELFAFTGSTSVSRTKFSATFTR